MSDQLDKGRIKELPTIEEMMKTYGNSVLRLAYSYVDDFSTAEDMFQEVFIKANAALSSFRGESSVKTWLFRITVNTCKDYLKSAYHKRTVFFEEGAEDTIAAADTISETEKRTDQNTAKIMIKEALAKLPDIYREVLVCLYFEEKSVTETAKVLEISEGTVKSRLSRARERLRELLPEELKGGAVNG